MMVARAVQAAERTLPRGAGPGRGTLVPEEGVEAMYSEEGLAKDEKHSPKKKSDRKVGESEVGQVRLATTAESSQTQTRLRARERAEAHIKAVTAMVDLRVQQHARISSWVTGEAVSIDPKTGKLRPVAPSSPSSSSQPSSSSAAVGSRSNAFTRLRTLAGIQSQSPPGEAEGVSLTATTTATITGTGAAAAAVRMSELTRAQQELESRAWPAIPEVWACGGCRDGTVVFMRVVDSDEVPRGGAVSEVASGAGARVVRSAFAGRRALCDDNHHQYRTLRTEISLAAAAGRGPGIELRMPSVSALSRRRAARLAASPSSASSEFENVALFTPTNTPRNRFRFADYVTTEGRVLSISSIQRLRYAGFITTNLELPRTPSMYRNIVREVYDSRHALAESRVLVEKLQGVLRMKRARERIRLLKEAVQADVDTKRKKRKGQSKKDRKKIALTIQTSGLGGEEEEEKEKEKVRTPIIMIVDKDMEAFL